MKNIHINIAMSLAALGMVSCSDWLDMPSYTATDSETVFATEEIADAYVKGCYRSVMPTELFYQYAAGETVTHSCEEELSNSKTMICNWYADAGTPVTLTSVYSESYKVIESVNVAIKYLNKLEETAKRNSQLGEAYCLRAFAYLNLITIYGDVPAVWQPMEDMDINAEETLYPKRQSRDIIYDHIVSDLQWAAENMPWFEETGYATTERLSKQGALALLARVALYAGGYSLRWDLNTNDESTMKVCRRSDEGRVKELYRIADDACRQIIDHGANRLIGSQADWDGYRYLWYNFCQRNLGALNEEVIWSLAQYGVTTNSKWGVYAHPGSRGGVYGSRKALQCILPTYYLSFDPSDVRRDVVCAPYSIYFLESGSSTDTWVDVATTFSCIMSGKFRLSWCVEPASASQRNLNIPLIRYADVLLMYAEAENYLNGAPTQAAKEALQQVRDRAGIGTMAVPSDQQGFDDALAQERKWEFGGELFLRGDLIRMGRISKELTTAKQQMLDLSARTGEYADVAKYRIYKFHVDAQKYGDDFYKMEYVEVTDAAEVDSILDIPSSASGYEAYRAKMAAIVAAHGVAVSANDKWYPVAMFEAYTSSFNGKARKTVGFGKGYNQIQLGASMYQKPTGMAENNGKYPAWINGTQGIYYGFKENHSELFPFANKSEGHPMVDNPNLTQLPGY